MSVPATISWSLRNPSSHGKFTIIGDQLTEKDLYSKIPKTYRIFRVCAGVCFVEETITLEIESGIPGFDFDIAGRLSVPLSLFAVATEIEIMDNKLYSLKEGKFHEITKAQDKLLINAASKVSDAKREMLEAIETFEQEKQKAKVLVESFNNE
jgi:hypothetical protein